MRTCHLAAAVLALAACSDPDPQTDPATLELSMSASIPAGVEAEYCKFVAIPEVWVDHDTVDFTAGSHHVLVFQTPYTSIPTHKDDGTPVDTSGVFDCSDGATNNWSVTKVIGGSQNRDSDSFLTFPAGVGVHIGGIVLINVHYINGSDVTLESDVTVTFSTVPEATIQQEGDVLFLYNPLISVPPGQTSTSRWRCPVYSDITIANVQSHMHSRGVGYEARVDDQAPFYVNTEWEGVPVQQYDNLVVPAGSTLDYHCDYRNTEGTAVYQGPRTTDEMCMLIGSYYPADARTANCLDPSGELPGGDWIGQGTATCVDTMGCMQTASDLFAITDCMLAASPAVTQEASELLRCMIAGGDCGAEISACGAK
ncbi:MAG: hypothetical protein ABI867_32525 [Kofleriaceae bacterium]